MKYLLDTNVCIAYLRGVDSALLERLRRHAPSDLAICATVRSELVYGALRSSNPTLQLAVVSQFLTPMRFLPMTEPIADMSAAIRAELAGAGQQIGPYDVQIAATARVHGLTLVTHNTKEFQRISGLLLEDWE